MAAGIYKITSPSGKVYIGQSIDIELRFRSYNNCGSNIKNQTALYYSFMKHGIDNHVFEVVEECNIEDLNDRERYWQEFYNVITDGLNSRLQASEDKSGYLSQETINKISKNRKGIPAYNRKLVLDTLTGVFYYSVVEAAESTNFCRQHVSADAIRRQG